MASPDTARRLARLVAWLGLTSLVLGLGSVAAGVTRRHQTWDVVLVALPASGLAAIVTLLLAGIAFRGRKTLQASEWRMYLGGIMGATMTLAVGAAFVLLVLLLIGHTGPR